jgi:hypothetical protein
MTLMDPESFRRRFEAPLKPSPTGQRNTESFNFKQGRKDHDKVDGLRGHKQDHHLEYGSHGNAGRTVSKMTIPPAVAECLVLDLLSMNGAPRKASFLDGEMRISRDLISVCDVGVQTD